MYKLSYSSISNWLSCPRKFKEVNVDYRFKSQSTFADTGVNVHAAIEAFIKGESDKYPLGEYEHDVIHNLRRLYAEHMPGVEVHVERSLAVNKEGHLVSWRDPSAILRGKTDVMLVTPGAIKIIDWKTGKRRDNKLQATTYDFLAGDIASENKATVSVSFDYLQNGRDPAIKVSESDRQQLKDIIKHIQEATEFPERPGPLCAWCPVPKAFCKFKED